ncbi:MAG: DUF2062 domain-containing protein [Desulfobacterales bacterium CG07_land_8_20_14_0_80_52_14]|nr:MAG: hypothetical protein COX20_06690 [Desulfobacterales bacterium CG23_combo_of_CG06-09_8_20_14_all_52_9]PIU50111.1 MAG: DUF2062 domain-containing protein [Desulfobacterales bacterium CG07_land_8_20_14_0_80_52_14]
MPITISSRRRLRYVAMNIYTKINNRIRDFILKAKRLEGDPHFIALGLAIGVFVGFTPTIPFHTVLAVALAFLFKGSKAAAAIGVWFSNPVTIPLFYFLSFRTGTFLFSISPFDAHPRTVLELIKMGADLTIAMLVGGVILGILPGVAAYFVTRRLIRRWQEKKRDIKDNPVGN